MAEMNFAVIWQRRYHDNTALIRTDKMGGDTLYVAFSNDRQMSGKLYKVDCRAVRNCCMKASNGAIRCYVVPVSWLEQEDMEIPDYIQQEIDYQKAEFERRYGRR